jgi:Big-like domain-containing protein/VCBS repeat protein
VSSPCAAGPLCDWRTGLAGVLLGNGDGTFQTASVYPTGGAATIMAAADLNRDGNADMIVGNSTDRIAVFLGNGDGTFEGPSYVDPSTPEMGGGAGVLTLAVTDLNNDGKLDFAVTTHSYGYSTVVINVLMGNGDGSFKSPVVNATAGYESAAVMVHDVDRDGKLDLVTVLCIANRIDCNTNFVGVLKGNGDGTFQPAIMSVGSGYHTYLRGVVDLNGDGKAEAVIATSPDAAGSEGLLGILQGNGNGSFERPVLYPVSKLWWVSAELADLNGDRKPDAVVSTLIGSTSFVGVMLNSAGAFHATTTSLAVSLNSSAFGQPITFAIRARSPIGTPEGNVALLDGDTILASGRLESGSATIPISSLTVGSHSIRAWYPLSADFGGSTSAKIDAAVHPATTSTNLASTTTLAGVHQPITFTATIDRQYGGPTTGTVGFFDGDNLIGRERVSENKADYTTAFKYTQLGLRTVRALYSGDANNLTSLSNEVKQYVGDFPVASKALLTTSASPIFVGQPVSFRAEVQPAELKYGPVPDGGLVTFQDGTRLLGLVPLVAGNANVTASSLAAGVHNVRATYAGSAVFRASTINLKQTVQRYPTKTARWSNMNPAERGEAVTFTAQVTSQGPSVPTGTVVFVDGTTKIGMATLSGGIAKLTKSTLTIGTHPITVRFAGDGEYSPSTSPVLNQTIQ